MKIDPDLENWNFWDRKFRKFSKENSMKIENFENLKKSKILFHWIFIGFFLDFENNREIFQISVKLFQKSLIFFEDEF